jgi:hypothetical protein
VAGRGPAAEVGRPVKRPETKGATAGWPGIIRSILDAPGTQRRAQRNSATAAGSSTRESTRVGLPPPHIEVAAPGDQGQFGLLEQRRKARKISSGITSHAPSSHLRSVATTNNWPTRIRSLIGMSGHSLLAATGITGRGATSSARR